MFPCELPDRSFHTKKIDDGRFEQVGWVGIWNSRSPAVSNHIAWRLAPGSSSCQYWYGVGAGPQRGQRASSSFLAPASAADVAQ